VSQIVDEELGTSDPRYHLIRAIPKAWDKHDAPRWEAAGNMLDHDTYHANEPLLRTAAMGLLVEISDALGTSSPADRATPGKARFAPASYGRWSTTWAASWKRRRRSTRSLRERLPRAPRARALRALGRSSCLAAASGDRETDCPHQ
jgi:hypothetical protein